MNFKILALKKKEAMSFRMNEYTLVVLVFVWFCFVSLNKTTLLNSSVFLSEPTSNYRRINWGWDCLGKKVKAKFNTQYAVY